jgi:hypothetical protein
MLTDAKLGIILKKIRFKDNEQKTKEGKKMNERMATQ